MLSYLPGIVFLAVGMAHMLFVSTRRVRFDDGHRRFYTLAWIWIICFTLWSLGMFTVFWRWAEQNNQLGGHFWAWVIWIVAFAVTNWVIHRRLYVSPKKRWSHRRQHERNKRLCANTQEEVYGVSRKLREHTQTERTLHYSYHPEPEIIKKAQKLGVDID